MADWVKLYMALGFTEEQARRYVAEGQGVKVTMGKDGVFVEWMPPKLAVDVKAAPDGR